jgi:phosphate-selective porin OprO/OprP
MNRMIIAPLIFFFFYFPESRGQSPDDLLNLLTRKGTITQGEADSLREAYSIKKHSAEDRLDSFPLSLGRMLRLSGYTQVRYQDYQLKGKIPGFDIRRARLDFQGDFSTRWGYRLLIDFVGASGANGTASTGGALISPTLFDAYIAYKPFSFLKIQAGQFTIPFSLENLTQDRYLETVDRSQVVSALVARKGDASNGLVDSIGNQNGRDLGIQLSGSLFKTGEGRYLADYYLALLDGAGINSLDNNQSKDIDGRIVLHPFSFLAVGGSYYNGYDRFTSSLLREQNRIRWGAELVMNYHDFSIKSEYLQGQEGNKNPTMHQGWYAQASYYFLPKHLQGVFRYDSYIPDQSKAQSKYIYYVFGLNYFFNIWTKIQVNYSRRTETGPSIDNDVFTVQLQVAF